MGLKITLMYMDLMKYPKLSIKQRNKKKNKQLKEIVRFAKENSPFYAELYKDIGDDFDITDLPPISKQDVAEHFDDFFTNPALNKKVVDEFMSDPSNRGKKLLDKYTVTTTSGTSGMPVITLKEDSVIAAENALTDIFVNKFSDHVAIICGTNGFYGIASSCAAAERDTKNADKWLKTFNADLSDKELCEQLNNYQPKIIMAFSSYFDILCDYQRRGLLNIHPDYICGTGEAMMESTRKDLKEVFGCPAYEAYGCTEMGMFATSVGCENMHLHLVDTNMIIEPIDENGNPVTDGSLSDGILVTSLSNKVQPMIRYRVDDRVTVHYDDCGCKIKSPWIDCEGRQTNTPYLYKNGKLIPVSTEIFLWPPDDYYPSIRSNDFSITIYNHKKIELRFNMYDDTDKQVIFEKLKADYLNLLKDFEDIEVILSPEPPESRKGAKKRKFITLIDE